MTPDDIAWVQGRLRGCKYLVATLHKCAQCLDVGDDALLAALGFANEEPSKRPTPASCGAAAEITAAAPTQNPTRGRCTKQC